MSRASGTCGTITKGLTFVSSGSQSRRGRSNTDKVLEEIKSEKFQSVDTDTNTQIPGVAQTPNRIN